MKRLWCEIRYGILQRWYLYLTGGILAILSCVQLQEVYGYQLPEVTPSYVEYLIGFLKGYFVLESKEFRIPVIYLCVVGGGLLAGIAYPFRELKSCQFSSLFSYRHAHTWWRTRVIWCIASGVFYFVFVYLSVGIFCLIQGGEFLRIPNEQIFAVLFSNAGREKIEVFSKLEIIFQVVILPMLSLGVLLLFQTYLQLHWNAGTSFLVCFVILVLSYWKMSPFLVGNYFMLARSAHITNQGLKCWEGYVVNLSYFVIILFVGEWQFRKKDILFEKEDI